jgi:hypothetical protein
MTFWDFVSNNALAVMVLLWFLWCVIDRLSTVYERRSESFDRHLHRLARRHEPRPMWSSTTTETKTETPTEPTQKIEEKR